MAVGDLEGMEGLVEGVDEWVVEGSWTTRVWKMVVVVLMVVVVFVYGITRFEIFLRRKTSGARGNMIYPLPSKFVPAETILFTL